jgi:hypothetical protein
MSAGEEILIKNLIKICAELWCRFMSKKGEESGGKKTLQSEAASWRKRNFREWD